MSGTFYTHRLTKLLEEFVLGAGMSVSISDAGSHIKLSEHLANIEQAARQKGIQIAVDDAGPNTVLHFTRR
ncbi:MAG: hypothetical protein AAFR23_04785 [Pseudomonadota bacterium]